MSEQKLLRNPNEYHLIRPINREKESILNPKIYRVFPDFEIPLGYEQMIVDDYGRSVYGKDGRLMPKYIGLKRWPHDFLRGESLPLTT